MIYRIIENIKSRSINLFYVYYLIKFVKFITKKKIKEKKSKRNIILVEFFQYYP